jgi:hypothetical protein
MIKIGLILIVLYFAYVFMILIQLSIGEIKTRKEFWNMITLYNVYLNYRKLK